MEEQSPRRNVNAIVKKESQKRKLGKISEEAKFDSKLKTFSNLDSFYAVKSMLHKINLVNNGELIGDLSRMKKGYLTEKTIKKIENEEEEDDILKINAKKHLESEVSKKLQNLHNLQYYKTNNTFKRKKNKTFHKNNVNNVIVPNIIENLEKKQSSHPKIYTEESCNFHDVLQERLKEIANEEPKKNLIKYDEEDIEETINKIKAENKILSCLNFEEKNEPLISEKYAEKFRKEASKLNKLVQKHSNFIYKQKLMNLDQSYQQFKNRINLGIKKKNIHTRKNNKQEEIKKKSSYEDNSFSNSNQTKTENFNLSNNKNFIKEFPSNINTTNPSPRPSLVSQNTKSGYLLQKMLTKKLEPSASFFTTSDKIIGKIDKISERSREEHKDLNIIFKEVTNGFQFLQKYTEKKKDNINSLRLLDVNFYKDQQDETKILHAKTTKSFRSATKKKASNYLN